MLNKVFDKVVTVITSDKAMQIAEQIATVIVIALVIEGAKATVNGIKAATSNAETTEVVSE